MPTVNSVLGDFVEASFPGYAPQSISGWSPAIVQGGAGVTWSDQLVFRCGGGGLPQLVYGYYVTRGIPGRLLWAELRPFGPILMATTADVVVVLPSLTLFP